MTRAPMLAAAALCAVLGIGWAPPAQLTSNRAVYDISLARTSGGGVAAARGRMAVEFRDTCDGWSTTQRLVADMTDSTGRASRTDFFVSAWESKDGRVMRFDIGDSSRGEARARLRGSASLDPNGVGAADLVEGKPAHFALPRGTEFPTAQTLAVLEAALRGETSFDHIVFQGGDTSDLYFSTALIGKPAEAKATAADRRSDRDGLLRNAAAWPVLVSYFPLGARGETPDYEVATRLYANGVNGSMSLIYPTYTLRATLVRLEALAPSC